MKITNRVLTRAGQGLDSARKANARDNIGAQVVLDASPVSETHIILSDVKEDGVTIAQKIAMGTHTHTVSDITDFPDRTFTELTSYESL